MSLVPARLKELRRVRKVSQKNVADALKIDQRGYRGYENGEVDPTTSRAAEIADYFDVSIDYLVGRRDEP